MGTGRAGPIGHGVSNSTLKTGLVRFVDADSATDLKTGGAVTLAGSSIATPFGNGRSLSTAQHIDTSFVTGTDFSSAGLTLAWYGRSVGAWNANQDLVRIDDSSDTFLLRPQWALMQVNGAGFSFPSQDSFAADTFGWVIATWDLGTVYFYHNTTLKHQHGQSDTAFGPGNTTMYVGNFTNSGDGTTNYTKFVLLWNRVLSGAELTELVSSPYNAVL